MLDRQKAGGEMFSTYEILVSKGLFKYRVMLRYLLKSKLETLKENIT